MPITANIFKHMEKEEKEEGKEGAVCVGGVGGKWECLVEISDTKVN